MKQFLLYVHSTVYVVALGEACLSVTSQCPVETDKWIEMVSDIQVPYPHTHSKQCVKRKFHFAYVQIFSNDS